MSNFVRLEKDVFKKPVREPTILKSGSHVARNLRLGSEEGVRTVNKMISTLRRGHFGSAICLLRMVRPRFRPRYLIAGTAADEQN